MKKVVLIICFLLLVGCTREKINFNEFEEVKYIEKNKDNISSVIIHKTTLGSNDCYEVDKDLAYDSIINIKIVKKSNISVTDDYLSYTFIFNDGTKKEFSFEGDYLNYKKENYTINNFNLLSLKEKDLIECEMQEE